MGVDDRLWTSNASPVARLFRNKVMFLLMIMLIYDKPLLSDQPPLSNHSQVPGGGLFKGDSTVFSLDPVHKGLVITELPCSPLFHNN